MKPLAIVVLAAAISNGQASLSLKEPIVESFASEQSCTAAGSPQASPYKHRLPEETQHPVAAENVNAPPPGEEEGVAAPAGRGGRRGKQ